jgi:hypothetical protein
MAAIDDIMAQLPVDQLAQQLGLDPATARAAAEQSLPALLGGLQANAQDPGGAASLNDALAQHDDDLLDGGVDLNQVDEADGEKIVGHVFGDNTDAVASRLAGAAPAAGLSSDTTKKLLAILAPIVLSYVTNKLRSRGGGAAPGATTSGGGLGDLLGGLLGGGGLGDLSAACSAQDARPEGVRRADRPRVAAGSAGWGLRWKATAGAARTCTDPGLIRATRPRPAARDRTRRRGRPPARGREGRAWRARA